MTEKCGYRPSFQQGNMSDETKKSGISQLFSNHVDEPKEEQPCLPLPLASFEMLQRYWSKLKCGREEHLKKICPNKPCNPSAMQEPSAEGIMQMAISRLHNLQSCSAYSIVFYPLSNFSEQFTRDVDLAVLLQASAEMFANKQFDHARKLLGICHQSASADGSTVQRVVHYFAKALEERIIIDTETTNSEFREGRKKIKVDVEEAAMSMEAAIIACEQDLPFSQVTKFTGVHAILDNIKFARRVHLIDFEICSGSHWTIIMQDLAKCPIELLKITAVGTSKQRIERTGKWLSSFAETMNLPFLFRAVVSDMKDLRKGLFELEEDEVIAVYAEYRLSTLLVCPEQLQTLIRFIQSLNPSVMVVAETEANTNVPTFLGRFNELLCYCTATFDSVATCMDRDNQYRTIAEKLLHWEFIRNVITKEGEERIYRHAKIDFWREFFARFGIEEEELSFSALYQANLLIQRNSRWSHCTLEMDGKSMIIKWKGTPVKFLSVWKFCKHKNTIHKK